LKLYVLVGVVKIEHEKGEAQDLEVEDDVPEDGAVLLHKAVLQSDLLPLLLYDIDVFFIQGHWGQQLHAHALLALQLVGLGLRVDLELWDEVLLADGATDGVGGEVLAKAGEDLLLLQRLIALLAESLKLKEQ